jgi:hypothetical protein
VDQCHHIVCPRRTLVAEYHVVEIVGVTGKTIKVLRVWLHGPDRVELLGKVSCPDADMGTDIESNTSILGQAKGYPPCPDLIIRTGKVCV